ncbi:MAG: hypothetical protein EXS38_06540 [Opitutus sp.]|nr:hypothetical protein [Opitutus sp.]
MPNSPTPAIAPVTRRWVGIGLVALAAYGVFLAERTSVVAGGSDTSGYLNSARLLASGRLQTEQRIPAEFNPQAQLHREHFMPLGFVALKDNPHLPPTYPVGLPLHFAVAGKLFGWTVGPLLVEVGLTLAAVWLCAAIARKLGIDPWLATAGAVTLAVFPVFLFTSLQPLSDTPATTWCLATVWLALRARQGRGWAIACGAAFAMAVFVRATNAVLLPALLVLLGTDWKRLALATVGGLPGAAWLAYYNHTLYGGALRSGYGAIEETFRWQYGPPTLVHFGYWLAVLAPAVLLALPFAAPWRRRPRELVALLLWFGAIVGVYTFYEISHETWWCLRFILPAFPPLILVGLLALGRLSLRARRVSAVALAVWALACSGYWSMHLHALRPKEHESDYAEASAKARELFPPNALVASFYVSGALYYYTDFPVLRWELIEGKEFIRYATLAQAAGRPIYAILFDGLEDEARRARMPGEWSRIGTVNRIGLWQLVGLPTGPRAL